MNVTKNSIFSGCLIASIAHAIMTNIYPDLSYEQSWDGANYSIQNSSGMRGTITFDRDYCVGAVRNDDSAFVVGGNSIQEYMKCFPLNIVDKAHEEALQYLLLERNGNIVPYVSSIFWADQTGIHFEKSCVDSIKEDLILFENIMLPKESAIDKWKEYYGMDSRVVELINNLYLMKIVDFSATIELSERQKKLIPGSYINNECAEALKELNIVL